VRRWWLSWLAPGLGTAIVLIGFIYDVLFAGLPYQDPTPQMQAVWDHHKRIADVIEVAGFVVTLLGFVVAVGFTLSALLRRRSSTEISS
jgi:hypothetical protein